MFYFPEIASTNGLIHTVPNRSESLGALYSLARIMGVGFLAKMLWDIRPTDSATVSELG